MRTRTGARVDRTSHADATPVGRAAREPGRALPAEVRSPLQMLTGHDFGRVRVHDGPASRDLADGLDANAVTTGRDVFLSGDAARMPLGENRRLLAHESMHSLQQGERRIEEARRLPVSAPADRSERDATASLPGLAIQRDLKGKHKVQGGEFTMNMKTIAREADECGMDGTITFMPSKSAPDGRDIRLMQAARTTNDEKGGVPVPGRGSDKRQMTTEDRGNAVQGGWMIDVASQASGAKPRTAKTAPAVSPYYSAHSPCKTRNHDGWKTGANVSPAWMYDQPHWDKKSTFDFETVAKDANTGHVYGTVMWGFKILDAWLGKVGNEYALGRNVTLQNTDKALERFNEFFRNPGSKNAP